MSRCVTSARDRAPGPGPGGGTERGREREGAAHGASDCPGALAARMAGLLVLALCLGAGVLLRDRLDAVPLNVYVLNVALPALAIVALRDAPTVSGWGVVSVWLVFAVAYLGFTALGRPLGWDRATVGCLALACGLSNTSFVGFPLLEAVVGPHAIPVAVPLDQLGSFLLLCTVAPVVAARASGEAWEVRAMAVRLARFPALWAVIVALALPADAWPAPLVDALGRVAATLSPVALVAVGAQLRLPERAAWGAFGAGLTYKLVLAPLLVWGWMRAGGEHDLALEVAVLEAGMAPMASGVLLAVAHGLRPELAGALLGVGVPLSLFTVWGWAQVVG